MSEWNELVLMKGKHEWNTETFRDGMVVKYRDKPEPEITIKKDGGTWVKRENGIDYLCMNPSDVVEEDDILNELSGTMRWKQINDKNGKPVLEITDEIAKLRPMVESGITGNIVPLLAVRDSAYSCGEIVKGRFYITEEINVGPMTSANCRIATMEDL